LVQKARPQRESGPAGDFRGRGDTKMGEGGNRRGMKNKRKCILTKWR